MARIGLEDVDKRIEASSGGNYINQFFLKNDKDHTIVRMLLKDIDEIEIHSVHDVKMTSKAGKEYRVSVDCFGDNCPMCREAMKHEGQKFPLVAKARDMVYVPLIRLYNANGDYEPTYQVFARSTRWFRDTMASFAARYDIDGYIEVERTGTGIKTSYNLYEARKDLKGNPLPELKSIEELKEDFDVQDDDIFGRSDSLIKSWTREQFLEFLETGTYPKNNDDEEAEDEEPEVKPRNRSSHGF